MILNIGLIQKMTTHLLLHDSASWILALQPLLAENGSDTHAQRSLGRRILVFRKETYPVRKPESHTSRAWRPTNRVDSNTRVSRNRNLLKAFVLLPSKHGRWSIRRWGNLDCYLGNSRMTMVRPTRLQKIDWTYAEISMHFAGNTKSLRILLRGHSTYHIC